MHEHALAQYDYDILRFMDARSLAEIFFRTTNDTAADILAPAPRSVQEAVLTILPLSRRITVAALIDGGRDTTADDAIAQLGELIAYPGFGFEFPETPPDELPPLPIPDAMPDMDNPHYNIFSATLEQTTDFWANLVHRARRHGLISLDPYYLPIVAADAEPVGVDETSQGLLFLALSGQPEQVVHEAMDAVRDEILKERKQIRHGMALIMRAMARGLEADAFARDAGKAMGLDPDDVDAALAEAERLPPLDEPTVQTPKALFTYLVKLHRLARTEGLLKVVPYAETARPRFVAKGLMFVIDGFEPDTVDEWLTLALRQQLRRDRRCVDMGITAATCLLRHPNDRIVREFLGAYAL